MMWIFWLIFSVFMTIGEIISVTFFMAWFAVGGLVGMVVALITPENIPLQIAIALVTSVVLLLATKPITKKFLSSKSDVESNINSLIGKKARVVEDITFIEGTGKVKLQGEVWKAVSKNSEITITKGSEVEVIAVDGVKLIVDLMPNIN